MPRCLGNHGWLRGDTGSELSGKSGILDREWKGKDFLIEGSAGMQVHRFPSNKEIT